MTRFDIDFSYYQYKDRNLMNWIMRVEQEIDEYTETNGSFSEALAEKFTVILMELMTNINPTPLMLELHRVLLDKLQREPLLDDVIVLCSYLKARMLNKKEEYNKIKPKYLN